MGVGLFITGTDTGVGKTVVTAGLLAAMTGAGLDAVAFKPVQSGAVPGASGPDSPDAAFYVKASGVAGSSSDYNLYRFIPPLSPHLAAEISGISIDPSAILNRCRDLLAEHRVLLVEGAGGICVPLTRSGYTVASLAGDLGFPLVVVARPGVGTINHTVLTISYALAAGLKVAGFIFNGPGGTKGDPERDNAGIIRQMTGVPFWGWLPYLPGLDVDAGLCEGLAEVAGKCLKWRKIGGLG
ncbi:MAG: hypothetical protein VR68_14250 [Peptococcaceae bacterium BRH_c4a]|nr:MAG: hypothetical protein VR68_14250 [Peptococcaceae bacterium BRH_c4a]